MLDKNKLEQKKSEPITKEEKTALSDEVTEKVVGGDIESSNIVGYNTEKLKIEQLKQKQN